MTKKKDREQNRTQENKHALKGATHESPWCFRTDQGERGKRGLNNENQGIPNKKVHLLCHGDVEHGDTASFPSLKTAPAEGSYHLMERERERERERESE